MKRGREISKNVHNLFLLCLENQNFFIKYYNEKHFRLETKVGLPS